MKQKLLTTSVAVIAALSVSASSVFAEWAPSGPIKLMIAFRAGGGVDTSARLLAEELIARKGWEVIPENIPGRGGSTMAMALKDEPADGLSIGMTAMVALTYDTAVDSNVGFSINDFTYLNTITGTQTALVAKADRGWKTLGDVFEAAKAGETITAGSMTARLTDALYYIGKVNGVTFNIVNVKGGKGGLNGVLADDLDIAWVAGPQANGVKSGDLVNLVSAEKTPLKVSPDAPLLTEYGVDLTFGSKFGVLAPNGLAPDAREALQNAILEILNDPESKLSKFVSKAFSGPELLAGAAFEADVIAAHEESKVLIKLTSE